jgi:hypothetical protein
MKDNELSALTEQIRSRVTEERTNAQRVDDLIYSTELALNTMKRLRADAQSRGAYDPELARILEQQGIGGLVATTESAASEAPLQSLATSSLPASAQSSAAAAGLKKLGQYGVQTAKQMTPLAPVLSKGYEVAKAAAPVAAAVASKAKELGLAALKKLKFWDADQNLLLDAPVFNPAVRIDGDELVVSFDKNANPEDCVQAVLDLDALEHKIENGLPLDEDEQVMLAAMDFDVIDFNVTE